MSGRRFDYLGAERIERSRYDRISFIPLMIVHEHEEEDREKEEEILMNVDSNLILFLGILWAWASPGRFFLGIPIIVVQRLFYYLYFFLCIVWY